MSKKMTYAAFRRAYNPPFKLGHEFDANYKVYRFCRQTTLMKPGDNITFWQTKSNLGHIAKYCYIATLGQLLKYGDLMYDPFEFSQGRDKGISLALFHHTELPVTAVKRVEILLGVCPDNTKIVNIENVQRYLNGIPTGPIQHTRWEDFDGNVHFTDETPNTIGEIPGSGGI